MSEDKITPGSTVHYHDCPCPTCLATRHALAVAETKRKARNALLSEAETEVKVSSALLEERQKEKLYAGAVGAAHMDSQENFISPSYAQRHSPNCNCSGCLARRQKAAHSRQERDPVPEADPWKHRSSKMHCSTCMWCVAKKSEQRASQSNPLGMPLVVLGRCRKNAPTIGGYPVVFPDTDWCGQHKLDETKV